MVEPVMLVPFLAHTYYGFLSSNCLFNVARNKDFTIDVQSEFDPASTLSKQMTITTAQYIDTYSFFEAAIGDKFDINSIESITFSNDMINTAFFFVTNDDANQKSTRNVFSMISDSTYFFAQSLTLSQVSSVSPSAAHARALLSSYNNQPVAQNHAQQNNRLFSCDRITLQLNIYCVFNGYTYQIMTSLGVGTHAVVWGASRLERWENNVLLSPSRLVSIKVYADTKMEQFQIEKDMLNRLKNVPNAVQMLDATWQSTDITGK